MITMMVCSVPAAPVSFCKIVVSEGSTFTETARRAQIPDLKGWTWAGGYGLRAGPQ
jgi:hypothetical protein